MEKISTVMDAYGTGLRASGFAHAASGTSAAWIAARKGTRVVAALAAPGTGEVCLQTAATGAVRDRFTVPNPGTTVSSGPPV